jgi:AsmA-like C-terminal region
MGLRRIRWYVMTVVGVVLLPPLLWVGIVLVAPTGWATRQVVAALESRTGCSVRLGALSVRLLGGIQLTNLEIGAPQSTSDPWLKTSGLRLDIGLLQLLLGKLEPKHLLVEELRLRVLRRADGRFELADLIAPAGVSGRTGPPPREQDRPSPERMSVKIESGTIELLDEPTQTALHFQSVEGEGVWEGQRAVIRTLRGTLNGGPFRCAGQLDRTGATSTVEANFRADDVVLDDGMNLLRYAVPVLAGAPLHLKGRFHADLHLKGCGTSCEELYRSWVGQGTVSLDPIDLNGAPLVAELSKIADFSSQRRVASIRSDFAVKDRRITTDRCALAIGHLPITFSGWTDLDGRIDYRVQIDGLRQRLPERARRLLRELDVDVESLTTLGLSGTVDRMVVQVNGVPLDGSALGKAGLGREDREKLRVLGRQFLDRIAR